MIEILVVELNYPGTTDELVISVSIYRSPQYPLKQFLYELDIVLCKANTSSRLIITGDFNVDLFARSTERDTFIKYFSDNGIMQSIAGVSTNYGSQLDCVFTKYFACSSCYYESYFSEC